MNWLPRVLVISGMLLSLAISPTELRAEISAAEAGMIAQRYAPTCCQRHADEFARNFAANARGCCRAHAEEDARRIANSLQAGGTKATLTSYSPTGYSGSTAGSMDPIAFQDALNRYRARNGRRPVVYNPSYDRIASTNNAEQRSYNRRGRKYKGHFYTERIAQNAAGGPKSVSSLLKMWANSPGHNALLLDPTSREFGLHHDGHYSTLVMPSQKLGFPAGHR